MIIKDLYSVNEAIRDKEVRVIGADGEMLGVMSSYQAQRLANDAELDLVKISPNAVPPVCKIMDYSKFKYEQSKREKENRKNQTIVELKEIRLSMTIDVGDIAVKTKQCLKFLEAGNKVKVSIRMKGRENARALGGSTGGRGFPVPVSATGTTAATTGTAAAPHTITAAHRTVSAIFLKGNKDNLTPLKAEPAFVL